MDLGYVLSLTGQTRKVKDLAKNEIGGKMSELGNGSKRIQLKWVFFTGQNVFLSISYKQIEIGNVSYG